ncbi:MAG: ribosomal protein S18-alanine N-acetyltransferase [Clostridia bacterium]|nr:ribosomal protein S18-alanine N-acetyltransferase [Clostridia bacterium]
MKIIFVCTGNTCRSPFAEGYFNSLGIYGIKAESRGISVNGMSASENSRKIAKLYGFDIDSHLSKSFTEDDFNADFIFTMSKKHKDFLVANGGRENKIFVLGLGISDPFGGDLSCYHDSLSQIKAEIDNLYFDGFFDNINIKEMNAKHISYIARIEKENFSEPWSETSIFESSKNNTIFFVAEEEKEPIGYIGLNFVADEGYITSVAVSCENRNRGVATKLLNKCFSFAKEKNLSFVSLEVRSSNENAKRLYSKLGLNPEGLRKDFYRNPREDAIIMTRRFN